jgi:hypothetical protein
MDISAPTSAHSAAHDSKRGDMKTGSHFANQWGLELTDAKPEDDYLHTDLCRKVGKHTCAETQFFGFSVPEERIHAINYIRQHPNMGHMLGGSLVFQGVKRQFLASEIADFRLYMTDEALQNDLHSVTLENGYHTEVIEPMQRFRISYRDESRKNAFDIYYSAVAPAIAYTTTGHFVQLMRAEGEVTLRGKTYEVNTLTIRDRTWGEARDENHVPLPVTTWMACVVDENFAFLANALDHPDLDPIWKPHFDIDPDKVLLGGWVYRDGEIVPIKSVRKITRYEPQTFIPTSFEFEMIDQRDRRYDVAGEIVASAPYNIYLNINTHMCLANITVNGQSGHCDFQDLQWTDFLQAVSR